MNIVMTIGKILLCLVSVVVVIAVMMQKPKDAASGAAFGQGGSGASFANRMKSNRLDGRLDTIAKYGAVVVMVLSFALVLLTKTAA